MASGFEGLPQWAKGVIAVVGTAAAVGIGYTIYKAIKSGAGKINLIRDKNDLIKQGQKPSYQRIAYDGYAKSLYNARSAENFGGTDEATIYGVFAKMKNDLDITELAESFGTKRLSFSFNDGDLVTFIQDEFDEGELSKLNSMLSSKGIKFRF